MPNIRDKRSKIQGLACLFFLLATTMVKSQNLTELQWSASFKDASFETFAQKVEEDFSLKIYYVPEWMDTVSITQTFEGTSLKEALDMVLKSNGLHYLLFNDMIVVSDFPFEESTPVFEIAKNTSSRSKRGAVIGNPQLKGRVEQATFTGRVVDAQKDQPIVGASIYIDALQKGTTTDLDGYYSLTIPPGNYLLKTYATGYEEDVSAINLYSDGKFDVALYEQAVALDEVVVTDRRPDANVNSIQMSVTQISSETIKQIPAFMGEADVMRSLTLMPGISSAGEINSGFNVRGGGAGQNLVLLNGAPMFNIAHLFGLFSAFNSDAINDVTLYKGGIPANYGGRVSSIMELEVKNGDENEFHGEGGLGLINSRVNFEGPLIKNKAGFMVGGRSTYSDWILKQLSDPQLQNSAASFYDLYGNLHFKIGEKNRLNLFGYFSKDNFDLDQEVDYEYENRLFSLKWNSVLSPQLLLNVTGALSNYNYKIGEDADEFSASTLTSELDHKSVAANLSYSGLNKHTVDFGGGMVLYGIEPGDFRPDGPESLEVPLTLDREKGRESAVYLNNQFEVSPKLSINYGVRFSHFQQLGPGVAYTYESDRTRALETIIDSTTFGNNEVMQTYQGLEPRASLKFNFDETSSVKLSYNRMRQYIHLISNSTVITPTDTYKLSGQNLQPQIGDQYAIGYFKNLNDNAIETSIEAYYKDIQNMPDFKNGAQILLNENLETDLINGSGLAYGVELFIKKNKGRLTGWLGYTYSRTLRRANGLFPEERINGGDYYPADFDKPHDISMVANYKISRRWRLSSNFVYATGRPITVQTAKFSTLGVPVVFFSERNAFRIPDYHRLDVSLTLDSRLKRDSKWKGSWSFGVYNIYGRKNVFSVFNRRGAFGRTDIKQLSILGLPFPFLSYNFKF